jgi:hypothetical protein
LTYRSESVLGCWKFGNYCNISNSITIRYFTRLLCKRQYAHGISEPTSFKKTARIPSGPQRVQLDTGLLTVVSSVPSYGYPYEYGAPIYEAHTGVSDYTWN